MSKFTSCDESTLASMVTTITDSIGPMVEPIKIAKCVASNVGMIAVATELSNERDVKELMLRHPVLMILNIMPPEVQQGFARDQLRAVVIAMAEHPTLFDQDELAQILEGRRTLRA